MADESRVVTLVKGPAGLGIAVTTAVVGEVKWPRVSSVRAGSEAERCGTVGVGDFIAEVNGFCVAGKSHHFVKELLQLAPNSSRVTLKLLEPGLLEEEVSHKSTTSHYPPEALRVRPFPSKTPSFNSPACWTDLPDQHTASVRRSQSDCYRKLHPLSSYPPSLQRVLRSSSTHSQGPWQGRPLQRGNLRQSTEGLSSSGLGDSLGSLSSLSRNDPTTAERWPECGEYTAVGTDLHLAVVRRNLSEVERLLTVGSSVYSLDSNGDTPLDLASRAGYHEVLSLMEELYEGSIASNSSKSACCTVLAAAVRQSPLVEQVGLGRLRGQRRRHTKADVRKELAKAYENIGSKV